MAASRTLRVFVRIAVLSLLAVAVYSQDGREGDGILLQDFLELAESKGIITQDQLSHLRKLADELGGVKTTAAEVELEEGPPKESLFMKMYNQLTLLNVLYFSGALLIMGAYTLFMTLAWEIFGGGGISSVMLFQVVLSGGIGVMLWSATEDYQFVGGILCSVSTGMVPFTVYGIQRALKIWPDEDPGVFQGFRNYVRSGWVIMEAATILVGLGYLMVVDFPFLLFPVSFSLWFLSMDLAPLFLKWKQGGYRDMWEIRRQLSLGFGLAMLVSGRVMEYTKGSHPDFGFWLYLFGLITFWFAVTFDFPEYDLHGSIYLLLNISLGLIGSQLDRTTFHVFGTLGVIAYVAGVISNRIKSERSFVLWTLKALAAAALFAQAIRRDGNIEILGALVCLLAFNFESIHFLGSGKLYYLFLLITNMGFVACSPSFDRPLSLWLFTLPSAQLPISIICSSVVIVYHAGLLKYTVSPQQSSMSTKGLLYHAYRLIASVLLSFAFFFVRQPGFAWIGGLGIPLVAANFSPVLREAVRKREPFPHAQQSYGILNVIPFLILVFGIAFSGYIESNILYFICCIAMGIVVFSYLDKWKVGGCMLSIGLILLSVPLQSKFMITIGAIYIFAYLSYLAYDVFKNSLLFPLALIALGILIIYSGITYQRQEAAIQGAFGNATPSFIKALLAGSFYSFWEPRGVFDWYYYLKQTTFSLENFLAMPANWLAWPAALVHALAKGPATSITYLCAAGVAILMLVALVVKFRNSLVEDLDASVEITKLTFSLGQDPSYNSHGLVVRAEGRKSPELEKPVYMALNIDGNSFWSVAASAFGEWTVGMGRSMFLPYKLTPNLISLSGFEKGKTAFSATILLGTGHKGSHKIHHNTITNALKKLRGVNSSAELECVILYANAWYHPYSKLCKETTTLEVIAKGVKIL